MGDMNSRVSAQAGPNLAPDIQGLKGFVENPDRDDPLFFAGREAEIEEIEGLVRLAREGKSGLTHVLTAAPGAGKTALLREIAERCRAQKTARPVYQPAKHFSDPEKVIRRLLEAVDPEAAKRLGLVETHTQGSSAGAEVGVSVPGLVKAGAQGRAQESVATQRKTLPTDFEEAFKLLADKKTPIVLLVDEAQQWGADDNGESTLLIDGHLNPSRLPLLIVAAGLDGTREVIASRGASRLKGTRPGSPPPVLGGLSQDEMREVCAAFFDHFGVVGNQARKAEWTEALIAGTNGWPRHLTNALRGAAEHLAEAGGDLEKASLEAALDTAESNRRDYYKDQMRPFARMPRLLSAVFSAMPQGGGFGAMIEDAIDDTYDAFPRLEHRMPRAEVFDNLRHKGLIQETPSGDYDCPIPSLRSAVEALCARQGCPVTGKPGSGASAAGLEVDEADEPAPV